MVAIVIIFGLITLFMGSYLLNKNTEAPFELNAIDSENCQSCANYGCRLKQPKEAR